MRWIRLDTTWSTSAWVSKLDPAARLVWIEILCHAKAHGYDGRVKRPDPEVFATRSVTGVTGADVMACEAAAIADGALSVDGHDWVIANWRLYQGDPTAVDRSKRYRKSKSRLSTSRSVTVDTRAVRGVTPTETETETEIQRTTTSADADDAFEEVWSVCPRGSKKLALGQYRKAVPKKTTHESLLAGWRHHVQGAREPQYVAHLYRWIRDERWSENGVVRQPISGALARPRL